MKLTKGEGARPDGQGAPVPGRAQTSALDGAEVRERHASESRHLRDNGQPSLGCAKGIIMMGTQHPGRFHHSAQQCSTLREQIVECSPRCGTFQVCVHVCVCQSQALASPSLGREWRPHLSSGDERLLRSRFANRRRAFGLGSKLARLRSSKCFPVCPQLRTSASATGMSQSGQKLPLSPWGSPELF
jgi:hypothetical protein